MKVKRYVNKNGKVWVWVRFSGRGHTEVVMPEDEFIRCYGKIDGGCIQQNLSERMVG